MKTRKPISTISYNSPDFLMSKLEELRENHTISFWAFIKHYKEEDENKDHIHLYIVPNTSIDTMCLQEFLQEPDLLYPDLPPLGCIDFVSTKAKDGFPDDWILYSTHYPPYLASKMQSRKYHYCKTSEFFVSDIDCFLNMWRHAFKGSDWAQRNQLLSVLADKHINPASLIENGSLPLSMACQVNAYDYMRNHYGQTDRGGNSGHD